MRRENDTRIITPMPIQLVKAIDKWRYANEIPSRSEAIRRLVNTALANVKPSRAKETVR